MYARLHFPQDRTRENPDLGPVFKFKLYYFKLHYFYQGFKGLRTKFHTGIKLKENCFVIFSLSSNHVKRGKVNFFTKSIRLSKR